MIQWIVVFVYLISFTGCLYALSCVKFELFCRVQPPIKVQLLWLLLSMGLGYIVAEFILALTIYHF